MPGKKVVLVIMDGWGEGIPGMHNAISEAHTPVADGLYAASPHTSLLTCGEHVGLPEGQMGNSEVGHLNIGAGRVVLQELAVINKAIAEKRIDENAVLKELFTYCLENGKPLHLAGLVSEGGVHSHSDHLAALCGLAHKAGVPAIHIHAFTDGRDTDPHSGAGFLDDLERKVMPFGARIATIVGRYYAMDRDKRWERIRIAYDLLVHGKGSRAASAHEAMQRSYGDGVTDEFVEPVVLHDKDGAPHLIREGDAVCCFNFRTDRCRQLTTALTQRDMPDHGMRRMSLKYVTMTRYDDAYRNVDVVFENKHIENTLGEVLSSAGIRQLRSSETEKYPHVTFFFNGGRETPFDGEERVLIPSPKVATYDLKPSMSALEVKNEVLKALEKGDCRFICVNFANADMVGHTGVFDAAVEAVETVDRCVGEILEAGKQVGYCFLITADHGNAEMMVNADGSPHTSHTTNPVPCFYVDADRPDAELRSGRLADLAPTILHLLEIPVPDEMTGKTLLKS